MLSPVLGDWSSRSGLGARKMIRTYSTNRNGSDRQQGYLTSPLHKSAEKTGEIISSCVFWKLLFNVKVTPSFFSGG